MKKLAVAAAILTSLMAFVGAVYAQEDGPTPSPDEINAIAKNLYCPVCENVPLDACGTAACAQWRQQIADLLTEGYTEQEIYDYFQRYGASVLPFPPPSGFNWLIYVVPPLILIVAVIILSRGFRKWTRQSARKPAFSKSVKTKYSQRLEDELKARR